MSGTTDTSTQAVQTQSDGKNTPATTSGSGGSFKATLTIFDLVIYGLIFMVPIAQFSIFGDVFQAANGMPTLAFFIGDIAMLFTAFSFGIMIHLWPSSGSIFTYAAKGIGKGVGFIAGWLMLMQYLISPDLMFIQAAQGLSEYLPDFPMWAMCLIFMAVVFLITMRGIKTTMIINRFALIAELIIYFMFIGFAIHYIVTTPETARFTPEVIVNPPKLNFGSMFSAVSLAALCYVGFGSVATLTEESKDGAKGPSRAMVIIVILLGVLFCLLAFVASCVDPSGKIIAQDPDNGFYLLAATVGGEWFGVVCVIGFALAIGLFTGLAAQTSVSRILYVMGNAGALPKWLGVLHKKTGTPRHATIFVTLLSLAMIMFLLMLGMDTVAKMQNFGALSTYCLLNITVLIYCFGKMKERRHWLRYFLFPLIGAAFTFVIFISLGFDALLIGCIWFILGIIYFLVATRALHKDIDVGDLK